MVSSFGECTQPFRKVKGDPNDGKIDKFCKHRDIYFNCWDNMKLEISKKCGKDNEKMMPALYHTTLIAYCDNESTANRQDDREDAMTPQKRINKKCPSLTGKHWLETCKDLLADFTSPNLCLRHQAIDRCLGLYFCDNYLNSAWNRQKYMDERSILQCRI
ncbi:hypothetical protein Ocin01_13334 [Orchesella cincta]|uniref:Uncharacterized protein n=1 Tax=Orchesella cincta TaxID=48709 RepID=A0A1D2MK50_ORCCI|nr:hypothetical protein Ocin01_13334 [Orchesella cincta]